MSISEISESDACGSGGECYIDENESTTAEINGRKRELTVLRKSNRFVDSLQWQELHSRSLQTRSVIYKPLASAIIRPMKTGGSGQVDLVIEWGGKEGVSWSGGITAEAHDDKGNYAKIEVKQDSDGNGRVGASSGHKEDSE